MRIAVVTDRFPALSETFVLNQITGLLTRGHEVDILPRRDAGDPVPHPDVERHRLLDRVRPPPHGAGVRSLGRRLPRAAGQALRVARRSPGLAHRVLNPLVSGREAASLSLLHWTDRIQEGPVPDVVLCHGGNNARTPVGLRSAGALDTPLATVFHGWDLSGYLGVGGREAHTELFAVGELFLPISEHWKRRLIELGCPEDRIVVHRMGIDPSRFRFQPRSLSGDEPVRLLTVGRLVEKKGVEYGIRALARAVAHAPDVDLRYTVVGDGPLRRSLEILARRLGVADRTDFAGPLEQDEVRERMTAAHVLLAPSVTASDGDQEGIPVVLMEAMATGLPVVATRHSGIPELVQDGRVGRLVPERDVEALAGALRELTSHPEAWEAMGRRGRARVVEQHDVTTLNDRLVNLLSRLAAGRSAV